MSKINIKDGGDLIAVPFTVGYWFVDAIPWLASFLGALWIAIRIYEWGRVRLFGMHPINLKL